MRQRKGVSSDSERPIEHNSASIQSELVYNDSYRVLVLQPSVRIQGETKGLTVADAALTWEGFILMLGDRLSDRPACEWD